MQSVPVLPLWLGRQVERHSGVPFHHFLGVLTCQESMLSECVLWAGGTRGHHMCPQSFKSPRSPWQESWVTPWRGLMGPAALQVGLEVPAQQGAWAAFPLALTLVSAPTALHGRHRSLWFASSCYAGLRERYWMHGRLSSLCFASSCYQGAECRFGMRGRYSSLWSAS